jgi:hypothetical protein
MKKELKMLTPRQYAALHDVAYTTVMKWLSASLLEGAIKQEMPFGTGHYYKIPESSPRPFRKPGIAKGTKRVKKPNGKASKRKGVSAK